MIRIFVGTADKWRDHEMVLANSIKKRTSESVQIEFMRAGEYGLQPSGCTGFTNFRFAVPFLAGGHGFAIYLDIDMLVLADIAELWAHRRTGWWVCCVNGSTEVSVIDCGLAPLLPPPDHVHRRTKHELFSSVPVHAGIPALWNVEDTVRDGMKLLHFTDLRQDWINGEHNSREALEILEREKNDYSRARNQQGGPQVGLAGI